MTIVVRPRIVGAIIGEMWMRQFVFVLLFSGLSTLASAADNVEAGRSVARNLCSTCHDVSADQQFPPALVNPAPTVVSIANRAGTTRETLQKFLASTHGDISAFPAKMPDLKLTEQQKSA